ncbi:unnamed protein product, partial [Staurois parvus]
GAYLPQGKQGICLGWHFSGGVAAFFRVSAPPPERRDIHSMGTRWDLREAAGCLMVYAEPESCSRGCPGL